MIYGINIVNFDVFDDDKVGVLAGCGCGSKGGDEAFRLRGLNALIGRNKTGKSSFINAMSFLKDTVTDNAADASITRGRPGFYNLLIDKEAPAAFRVLFKVRDNEAKDTLYLQYELKIAAGVFKSPQIIEERVCKSVMDEDGTKHIETIMEFKDGKGQIRGRTESINDHHTTALGIYGRIHEYAEINLIYNEIYRWFF